MNATEITNRSPAWITHDLIKSDARAMERAERVSVYEGCRTGGSIPPGHIEISLSTASGRPYAFLIKPDGSFEAVS